jgi:hypothetical protein
MNLKTALLAAIAIAPLVASTVHGQKPGLSIRTALSLGLAPTHEAKLVQGYLLLGLPEK